MSLERGSFHFPSPSLFSLTHTIHHTPYTHFLFHLFILFRSGYSAGAIALGQSLIDVDSKLTRVVLVTPEVEEFNRLLLAKFWKVVDVEPIPCNHKLDPSITSQEFDLKGENYLAGCFLFFYLTTND